MVFFRIVTLLPAFNASLRSSSGYVNAVMLGRALSTHAISNEPNSQQTGRTYNGTLKASSSAVNISKPIDSNKRKFERTISTTSTLGALHDSTVFWSENDFEDDAAIDLSDSPPLPKYSAQHLSPNRALNEVAYPTLPPLPPPASSSASVPWSSSPPEHLNKPKLAVKAAEDPDKRPSKRRTLPWLDKYKDEQTQKTTSSIYPWNKTASDTKREQNEFRKKNRVRTQNPAQPQIMTSANKSIPRTHLSDEQKQILDAVVDGGKSIFFTGAAGTGKSVLMRAIISRLRDKYKREPDRVAVTASTGLAACNIEGITLHSFAGIGLGRDPIPKLVSRIKRTAALKQRWLRTKVLIVDEISMVDGDLFDKLEQIARMVRGSGRPFGGIQLVVTGDFFQLPPVVDKNATAKFAFDAATWNTSIEHTVILTNVFRQRDPRLANMLHELRLGKMTPATINAFQRLTRPLDSKDEIVATQLFPTRAEVDTANQSRMNMLVGQEMTFKAIDTGSQDPQTRAKTLSNFMAPETLTLKKGAQVMLIKNIDSQLVNGSIGRVQCFMNRNDFTVYKDNEEMYHQAHEPEDVGDLEQNQINAKARAAINAARYNADKYNTDGPSEKVWPLVRFSLPDGTCRELLCYPEDFKTEAPGGEILAKRVQVPLILSWSISVHKAQGQTLEKVSVDLRRCFEFAQVYVALSRCTTLAGLQVLNFDPVS